MSTVALLASCKSCFRSKSVKGKRKGVQLLNKIILLRMNIWTFQTMWSLQTIMVPSSVHTLLYRLARGVSGVFRDHKRCNLSPNGSVVTDTLTSSLIWLDCQLSAIKELRNTRRDNHRQGVSLH